MTRIIHYWKHVLARGKTPRPIFAIVSFGGEQPEGYIIGWSVSRAESVKRMATLGSELKLAKITLEARQ